MHGRSWTASRHLFSRLDAVLPLIGQHRLDAVHAASMQQCNSSTSLSTAFNIFKIPMKFHVVFLISECVLPCKCNLFLHLIPCLYILVNFSSNRTSYTRFRFYRLSFRRP